MRCIRSGGAKKQSKQSKVRANKKITFGELVADTHITEQ